MYLKMCLEHKLSCQDRFCFFSNKFKTSLKSISETRKPTEATAEEVNYEFIFLTSLMYE